MDSAIIDTDAPDAADTVTELLETHTKDVLVVEDLVDHFTAHAYFIPLTDGTTLQRRWAFKNDQHTAHTDPTPIGTWSSSRRPHEEIAQHIIDSGKDRITITEIGEIDVVAETPANTEFLVTIPEQQFDKHSTRYFEGHQVEPPQI